MFTSKLAIFISAALFLSVSAQPSPHHRRVAHNKRSQRAHNKRTTCKPRTQRYSSVTATATRAAFSIIPSAVVSSAVAEAPSDVVIPSSVYDEPKPTKADASSHAVASPTTSAKPVASSSSVDAPEPSKPVVVQTGNMRKLLPVSSKKVWSTSEEHDGSRSLSDDTLTPTKEIKALAHPYISAPDGKKSMKVHYPKGSYTFTHSPQGGVSFYAQGPDDFDLTNAREATFGYSLLFEEGFDFNMGGKLFGLYGGDSAEAAVSCSGGRRSDACFSARLMWRTDGAGEFYTYFPQHEANQKMCTVKPESDCNPTYGNSVGRGAFKFVAGERIYLSQRIRLNDVGQSNGEIELFVNGKSVINVDGLVLRVREAGRFRGLQMQSFFGGSQPKWASPKAQNTYFSDFTVAVTSTF